MSNEEHLKYSDIQKIHKKLVVYYNWLYIFVYISREIFMKYVLQADNAARGIFVLGILALLLNIREVTRFFLNRKHPACLLWFSLVAYSFLNSLIMGFTSDDGAMIFVRVNFFDPLIFLMVATHMLRTRSQQTMVAMLASLLFCVVIGTARIDMSNSIDGRYLNRFMGNALPLLSVPLVLVASILRRDNLIKWIFIPIVLISSASIMLSATRKAFAAVVVILLAFLVSENSKKKISSLVRKAIMFAMAFIVLGIVMKNSMLGNRFGSTIDTQNVVYPLVSNPVVNKMLNVFLGDRARMYYNGGILFLEHPLNGIGLCNYTVITGEFYRIHSEYVVQLCENGIIGFGLYSAFIAVVLHGLICLKPKQSTHIIIVAGFLAILLINFTAWTYCMDYAMVVYSIVLSTIYPKKYKVLAVDNDEEDDSDSK